jgi:hypothetical protein
MTVASIQSSVGWAPPIQNLSREDLAIGDVVTVSSVNIGTSYAWSLAYVPDGSAAVFAPVGGDVTRGPITFTVDKVGPYLVRLQYSTPKVDIASPVSSGESLVLNGITLNAVSGAAGVNQFTVTGTAITDAAAIATAINLATNGFSATLLASNAVGSTQVVVTPKVDGTAVVITSSTAQMVVGTATTEQFVRLRALTTFGSLHLVAAGEQYGGSNPPVPVDIDPVGWTNEQNNNLLSLLGLIETTSASGNILYVDPTSGDYNTIQAAIDYAVSQTPTVTSQWLVAVRPGLYQEQLTFASFVHVVGWPAPQETTSTSSGAEVVQVQQTAAMGPHSILMPVANDCLLISDIHFDRPGASADPVIQEQAGNIGFTHIHRCRITASSSGASYVATESTTLIEECYLATGSGWSLTIAGSTTQLDRVVVGGLSGIRLTHGATATLRDCWVEPTGSSAVDITFTGVANPGATFEAVYSRFVGTCAVNATGVGCSTNVAFSANWCDFGTPGDISMDGGNVGGTAQLNLGSTRHGSISVTNGAAYSAGVPADTVFYDNALVSHSRIIGVTEIAGDLTAANVQDAIDEVYSYAINVRTLDDAYDAGMVGGGLGRDIVADSEAVRILDGNPPGSSTPITSTDGQLQVVSKIEVGGIGKAEIKLDPNPFGMGAEVTLGEELWIGNAPHGTPTFIWANSTQSPTYHNYDLIISAHPADGGGQLGSLTLRGGFGLNSGKGTDPSGGDIYILGGDALGANAPVGPTPPDGGTVYLAPGGVNSASGGSVGTILLGRPQDAVASVLAAPNAYAAPAANGSVTFGTDMGAFTITVNAADAIGTTISRFNTTQYVVASENPAGFIQLESASKGPLSQVFYVGGDAATEVAIGGFSAALQTDGSWPSQMEVVVSAANEISFGPSGIAGPLIYNADTGKMTVPGVIDPTGMIFSESTLTNMTLPANGWTGTNIGGLYVSDGTDGLVDNHLYYVFEDGTPIDLSGGGTGTVVGPGASTDNALVRWDGATGTIIQNSDAILTDTGSLTLSGDLAVVKSGPGVNASIAVDRFVGTDAATVSFRTASLFDWEVGTSAGTSDFSVVSSAGTPISVTGAGAVTINSAYTLPVADGAASDVLTTDGGGTVTWQPGGGAGLPTPTAEGEILYAVTAAAFVRATPLVNSSGFLLVNSSGNMVVI